MDKFTGKANEIVLFLMGQNIDRDQIWDLIPHKDIKKRSLDSNAYFHVLCDKLRQKLGISMARCKNELIASYGQCFYVEDEPMVYKTNAPEEYMRELETIHTKCVKVSEENGKPVYFYRVYRGSHSYNSAEMAALIKGTIEECLQQGDIEVATPDEIAHMASLWDKKCEQSNKGSSNTARSEEKS